MKARGGIFSVLSTVALLGVAFATLVRGQTSTPLQCFYDDLGQLTKVIDPSGNVTTYTYDAVGDILQVSQSTIKPGVLAIFNFNPQQGSVGANVTIQGQNFSSAPTSNTVTFNGTLATVLSATSTTLLVAVPLGASTGPISITVGGATTPSPNFVVLSAIEVLPLNPSALLGNTVQFTATETLSDGSSKDVTTTATWSSMLPAIATVSNTQGSAGLATTLATGAISIVATLGSMSGSTALTVNPPILVSLAITPGNPSLASGITAHLIATGTFSNGSTQSETNAVTWTSSNPAVATVGSATGSVTTVATGTTTIAATLGSVSSSTTLTVSPLTASVPRFALVTNSFDNTVSTFAVDAGTGQLRTTGYANPGLNLNLQGSYAAIDPSGQFAYVLNPSQNVFGFSIDPNRGTLTPMPGSPFGSNASSVAVDPTGTFAFITSTTAGNNNTIAVYTLGSGGVLTAVPGGSSTTGSSPTWVTTDPSGKFVYVANSRGGSISAFVLNHANGSLTPVSGSPFAALNCSQMTTDPSGRFLYLACGGGLTAFTIDPTSGALTPITSVSKPLLGTRWVTAEPSGKFLYILTQTEVSGFNIDPATGSLTPVPQSPFPVEQQGNLFPAVSMAVDPSGKFAYVVSLLGGDIASYTIDNASGSLIAGQSYHSRGFPTAIAISKAGVPLTFTPNFAYVANNADNTVSASSINPVTGALSPVPGSPFAAGTGPASVISDPAGKSVYVTNSIANTVSGYSIVPATGALVPSSGSPFAAGSGPASVAVEPSSSFAFVANQASNNVSAYTIAPAGGALSPFPKSVAAGSAPIALAADPTGSFVYVANSGSNDVSAYDIEMQGITDVLSQGTISGSPTGTFPAGTNPSALTVDVSGRFLYVANAGSNNVSAYSITPWGDGAFAGNLSQITGSPFPVGTSPSALAVDVSGRFLYVANAGSNNVSAYSINPSTGALTAMANSPFAAGTQPSSVTVDFSGKFLYVTNSGGKSVSLFTIDPASGALSPAGSFPTGSNPTSITTTGKIQ